MKPEHRHKFTVCGYSGKKVLFLCYECRERRGRVASKEEMRDLLDEDRTKKIHKVWNEFVKKFLPKEQVDYGYDLMMKIEKWAKKYPNDVRVVFCDDSYHSNSILVLVEHKTTDFYMGTTVVMISQCAPQEPATFFLYPNHVGYLSKALKDIRRQARPIEQAERKAEVERSRRMAKWKP